MHIIYNASTQSGVTDNHKHFETVVQGQPWKLLPIGSLRLINHHTTLIDKNIWNSELTNPFCWKFRVHRDLDLENCLVIISVTAIANFSRVVWYRGCSWLLGMDPLMKTKLPRRSGVSSTLLWPSETCSSTNKKRIIGWPAPSMTNSQ